MRLHPVKRKPASAKQRAIGTSYTYFLLIDRRMNDASSTHSTKRLMNFDSVPAVLAAHLAEIAVNLAVTAANGLNLSVALAVARLGGRAVVQRHRDDVLSTRLLLHFALSPVDIAVGATDRLVRFPLVRARFRARVIGGNLHAGADMSQFGTPTGLHVR